MFTPRPVLRLVAHHTTAERIVGCGGGGCAASTQPGYHSGEAVCAWAAVMKSYVRFPPKDVID